MKITLNMFNIPKIQHANFYIDQAIEQMQQYAVKQREEIQTRWSAVRTEKQKKRTTDDVNIEKRKDLELQKIRFLNQKCNEQLRKIAKSFPNFSTIDTIYTELINTSQTPVPKIKDALGRLYWIGDSIDEFSQTTELKIKRARTNQTIGFIIKKYLGKVNSLYKKNRNFFELLQESTQFINKLPQFEDINTIAIAGFPNVGKSTLMKNLSGSKVEIKNYAFTTKGLMLGYIEDLQKKAIQLIDTPGLLGRDKNNSIEQRAQIVISKHSDTIIFVLDITQTCGFSIEQQIKLLKQTATIPTPIIIYLSKTDIYNQEDKENQKQIENKIKKYKTYTSYKDLKEDLIKKNREKQKTIFDPKKLKISK